jgi:hypothetical protein
MLQSHAGAGQNVDRTGDDPSEPASRLPLMAQPTDGVTIKNPELATVREAMRELSRLLDQLDTGEIEKVVLTQRNQMRAVLLTVERYAELQARPTA